MTVALFLGRFQPPHKGHVQVIEEILKGHDMIVVGLGSSQYSGTFENPLTTEERRELFQAIFSELRISLDPFTIVPIPDIHDDERYVDHVKNLVPAFDVVYSGNELVTRLFEEKGYKVVQVPRYNGYEGRIIREQMRAGDSRYKEALPEVCAKLIETWFVNDRLQKI